MLLETYADYYLSSSYMDVYTPTYLLTYLLGRTFSKVDNEFAIGTNHIIPQDFNETEHIVIGDVSNTQLSSCLLPLYLST